MSFFGEEKPRSVAPAVPFRKQADAAEKLIPRGREFPHYYRGPDGWGKTFPPVQPGRKKERERHWNANVPK